MEPPERFVDPCLRVANADVELHGQARKDKEALRMFRGDLAQPPADEVTAEDRLLLFVDRAQRKPWIARRPELLGGLPERLGKEGVGPPVRFDTNHPDARETGEMTLDPPPGDVQL